MRLIKKIFRLVKFIIKVLFYLFKKLYSLPPIFLTLKYSSSGGTNLQINLKKNRWHILNQNLHKYGIFFNLSVI